MCKSTFKIIVLYCISLLMTLSVIASSGGVCDEFAYIKTFGNKAIHYRKVLQDVCSSKEEKKAVAGHLLSCSLDFLVEFKKNGGSCAHFLNLYREVQKKKAGIKAYVEKCYKLPNIATLTVQNPITVFDIFDSLHIFWLLEGKSFEVMMQELFFIERINDLNPKKEFDMHNIQPFFQALSREKQHYQRPGISNFNTLASQMFDQAQLSISETANAYQQRETGLASGSSAKPINLPKIRLQKKLEKCKKVSPLTAGNAVGNVDHDRKIRIKNNEMKIANLEVEQLKDGNRLRLQLEKELVLAADQEKKEIAKHDVLKDQQQRAEIKKYAKKKAEEDALVFAKQQKKLRYKESLKRAKHKKALTLLEHFQQNTQTKKMIESLKLWKAYTNQEREKSRHVELVSMFDRTSLHPLLNNREIAIQLVPTVYAKKLKKETVQQAEYATLLSNLIMRSHFKCYPQSRQIYALDVAGLEDGYLQGNKWDPNYLLDKQHYKQMLNGADVRLLVQNHLRAQIQSHDNAQAMVPAPLQLRKGANTLLPYAPLCLTCKKNGLIDYQNSI